MKTILHIFTFALFLLAVLAVSASSVSADTGGNGRCSAGGGVYAENTPSAGHEGYSVYCQAGNKAVADTSTEPAPYCWVRTWNDCLTIQGISSSPPANLPPNPGPPAVQPPVCVSNGYCSAFPSCGQTLTGVDNCGLPCTRTGSACPAPQAVVQPALATVTQQQSSQNNNNNNNQNNNNNNNTSSSQATAVAQGGSVTIHQQTTREIIREVPAPQRVQTQTTVQQAQPRVVYTQPQVQAQPRVVQVSGAQVQQVKELPKTGLPVAGLLLAGLLPLGWKFKRFGSATKEEVTATYLWEDRQARLG